MFSLRIPLYTCETLLKYIGGLHLYLRHTILMFSPNNIDEVLVQATHLEASKGKHGFDDVLRRPKVQEEVERPERED